VLAVQGKRWKLCGGIFTVGCSEDISVTLISIGEFRELSEAQTCAHFARSYTSDSEPSKTANVQSYHSLL
jgi:hypothetical protein